MFIKKDVLYKHQQTQTPHSQEEDKMSYYSSPEEMYTIKSAKYKKEGDRYWAKAKSGESGYYYKKARNCYAEAKRNAERAKEAKGRTF